MAKHKEEWETCDQCGKKIDEADGCRTVVCRMRELSEPIINKRGDYCSEMCASQGLEHNLQVIYGHFNDGVWEGKE